MKKVIKDIIIIGAGPAGIACAIQLKRSGISPLVIEKNKTGGLLYEANLVENYPGFPKGVRGSRLALLFRRQFENESISLIKKEVKSLNYLRGKFVIRTSGKVYYSKYLVIATGTKPKKNYCAKLPSNIRDKIFCGISRITCLKNKVILIVGAGDLAFDYAINLGRNNKIILINRSDKIRCIHLLYKRALKLKNFRYIENSLIKNAEFIDKLGKLNVILDKAGHEVSVRVNLILYAIGRVPDSDFISENLKTKSKELIKSGLLYFTGDVVNKNYRQTAISVGNGILAAMQITERLRGIT
jgi:thioredoxin reductase